ALYYVTAGSDEIGEFASYSSEGPTLEDGRLKPELVAPGGDQSYTEGVVSTSSNPWSGAGTSGSINGVYEFPEWQSDDSYIRLSGTSMAAPHVTGVCAKIRDWSPEVHSELLKALLINTTLPIKGNSSVSMGAYANTQVGYGLVNGFSPTTYYGGESSRLLYAEGWIDENDSPLWHDWSITVPSGTDKLIVTMAHNDQEGEYSSFHALNDDMDLSLISPTGTQSHAWAYLPSNVDSESPLEKMVILNPASGTWTVRVEFSWSPGFDNPFIFAEQRYGLVAHAILMTPALGLSVAQSTVNVSPGEDFTIQPTVTNTGGYIAAGVTVRAAGSSSFGGDINTTRYADNLMHEGASVSPQISLTAPSSPGQYLMTVEADGINKEFDTSSYPKTQTVTVNVVSPLSPDPMTWAQQPSASSTSQIDMAANTLSGGLSPYQYSFDYVTSPTGGGGGSDSDWQSSTSYSDAGLGVNHQYTYRCMGRDDLGTEVAWSSQSSKYTEIQPCTGISFGGVTSTSISASSINTPSGVTRGSSGLIVRNQTAGTNSGWRQNNNYWTSGSLVPNKAYAFTAQSRNGDAQTTSQSGQQTKYTLSVPPDVACDRDVGTTYPPGTVFTFTNEAGWGEGGVDHYHWVFDMSPSTTPTAGSASWSSSTLTQTPGEGSWYLHVLSHNAEHAPNGVAHYGPYSVLNEIVTLIVPNGAEQWCAGTTEWIEWSGVNFTGNITIELSRSGPGGPWELLVEDTPSDGQEPWAVTGPASNDCYIRIADSVDGAPSDVSDGPFEIIVESVIVVSPDGGEIWLAGESHQVEWETNPCISEVDVELSRTGPGGGWETLFSCIP
ncbi:S8 family serine peptidase, partial [bacterium]|nr:S8 family serine peptidase [bacterium]